MRNWLTTALSILGAFVLVHASVAHEVVLLPMSSDDGDSVLPIVTSSEHLSLSATSLSFGGVGVGATGDRELTLVNVTRRVLTLTFEAPESSVTVEPASLTLQPAGGTGDSSTVTVSWAPTLGGPLADPLVLASSHAGHAGPRQDSVALSGTAVGAVLDPQPVHFEVVRSGATEQAVVSLTNPSAGDTIDVVLAFTGSSQIGVSEAQVQLAPGEQRTVTVTWSPVGTTTLLATLAAEVYVPGSPDPVVQTKTFEGWSKDYPTVTPRALHFGEAVIGTSTSKQLSLDNTGSDAVTVELELGLDFAMLPNNVTLGRVNLFGQSLPAQLTLTPGESRTMDVTWSPSTAAPITGTIAYRVWYPDTVRSGFFTPLYELWPISGTPRNGPRLEVRVDGVVSGTMDFGERPAVLYDDVTATEMTLTVTNVGDMPAADVALVPIDEEIATFPDFVVSLCYGLRGAFSFCAENPLVSSDLAPGQSSTSIVRYYPGSVGEHRVDFEVWTPSAPPAAPLTPLTFLGYGLPHLIADTLQDASSAADPSKMTSNNGPGIDSFDYDPLGSYRPTGFDAETVFAAGDVDHVDMRSGNLVLTVPIGGPVTARGGLGVQLSAVYNVNLWARRTMYDYAESQAREHDRVRFLRDNFEFPNPAFNNGMGWSFHLGRLIPSELASTGPGGNWEAIQHVPEAGSYWLYISPNGTTYRFYATLNVPESHKGEHSGSYDNRPYLYERTGTGMRLRRVSASQRILEFPNGEYHVFVQRGAGHSPAALPTDEWVLDSIHDRFGNSLDVGYKTSPERWEITDSDGWRTTKVFFTDSVGGQALGPFHPWVVDRVELPGLGGAGSRVVRFDYSVHLDQERPPQSSWPGPPAVNPDLTVDVVRLDGITLADGTAYDFTYATGALTNFMMTDATIPSGARIHYELGLARTGWESCRPGPDFSGWKPQGVVRRTVYGGLDNTQGNPEVLADTRYVRGVRRHSVIAAGGTPSDGYCEAYFKPHSEEPPTEQVVAEWKLIEAGAAAKSSVEVFYFSIWPFPHDCGPGLPGCTGNRSAAGWTNRENGANMTRAVPDPVSDSGGPRYLASRLYSCDFNLAQTHLPSEALIWGRNVDTLVAGCTRLESRYARYEHPVPWLTCGHSENDCGLAPRLADSRVVYEDDPAPGGKRFARTAYSDYDGLGHYRTTATGGNFPARNDLTTFQNWNAGGGTVEVNGDGSITCTGCSNGEVAIPNPWVLGTWNRKTVSEAGTTYRTDACFDADGWMRAERNLAGGGLGATDLVTFFDHQGGELSSERHFGADTWAQMPSGSGWCSSSFPDGQADFIVDHQFQFGVLSRQHVRDTSIWDVWRQIDRSTGWIASETANSGETVTFSYDETGRVEKMTSDRAANHELAYHRVDRGTAEVWKVIARSFEKGEGSAAGNGAVTRYEIDFDELGRPIEERWLHPDADLGDPSTWSKQVTEYHSGGRIKSRTTPNNPGKKTSAVYDVRGRLTKLTQPDGQHLDYLWTGIGELDELRSVRTAAGIKTAFVRTRFDREGKVHEISMGEHNSPNVDHVTRYTRDPIGRISSVVRTAGAASQTRSWQRDGRGFLLSESIPEKQIENPSSPGSYLLTKSESSSFNTRGQARTLRERQGSTTIRSTAITYDDLGRAATVKVDGKSLKQWEYHECPAATGSTPNLSSCTGENGQVHFATRWSYWTAAEGEEVLCPGFNAAWLRVDDELDYDNAGRVGQKRTSVLCGNSGATRIAADFSQSWTWNDLGKLQASRYPCHGAACLAQPSSSRTVSYGFRRGLLESVSSGSLLGADFSYHPDGRLARIDHDNGRFDLFAADSNGMPRIGAIELGQATPGGAPLLNLGSYSYDGSGSITAIGADAFRYDVVGRLVSATLSHNSGLTTTYGYDGFDNRTGIGLDAVNNHLVGTNPSTGATVEYDPFGNLAESTTGHRLIYDGLDKLQAIYDKGSGADCNASSTPCSLMIYDASDLRILSWRTGRGHRWTPRNYRGQVVADFTGATFGQIGLEKEYLFAGSSLLSSMDSSGVRHYHLDHQGNSRLVTDGLGGELGQIHVKPFGELIEPLDPAIDDERMDYTGHERDDDGLTMYMNARQYFIAAGRYLQVDPVRDTSSWSLYSYAGNNPMQLVDPTGLYVTNCQPGDKRCAQDAKNFEKQREKLLKSNNPRAQRAANAYGDPGVDNGVTVNFVPGKKNANVDHDFDFDQATGTSTPKQTVHFGTKVAAKKLRAQIGHEGSHLADYAELIATVDSKGGYDQALNLTEYDTEFRAYQLSHEILDSMGFSADYCPDGGCVLGSAVPEVQGVKDPTALIDKILADPKGLYQVTPSNPGKRWF